MMLLYYAPGSCSLASHIALEEAGAVYETARMDLRAGDQRQADYLALNPLGRVPALAVDGAVLTENAAILAYIAQRFPQAGLAPINDALAFARVQGFNVFLASTVHPAHSHGVRGSRWADDASAIAAMKAKMPRVVSDCFELIERDWLVGPWVMGETYSICDPYLFTLARWLEGDSVDPARFPKVEAHRRRMAERPAVRKVLAVEGAEEPLWRKTLA